MNETTFLIRLSFGMALTAFALWDQKSKRLPMMPIFGLLAAGILLICMKERGNLQNTLLGVGIGALFCGMAKLTDGGIGMGDGLLALLTGLYMGGTFTFLCLCFSFLFSAVAALYLISFQKKGKKDRLPFIPFMLAGYIMTNWLQGGWVL